ncbi:deazaflavin-dependent oxidoreductase, nitroreductase family [Nonomuraea solani]|uniref:Deazaflavin-dependent oxidoreductase, nitroreductase family n=1 Tax=Nonomuraea solani TaxID=1144553 RepID=A0A1H5Y8W7_9ACTN|nr:nitroreductase family deazaflavin-dependent oxidoreductase [Nonomuraea solani]SEG20225.1 deazaflavin-dependent oxidoreductase, nitroreductase family [Nonomuraea solani]
MVDQQQSSGGVRARVSTALRPFFQWLAGTKGFAKIAPRIVPPLDRLINRMTGGRVLMGDQMIPHLLLTTTGSKSGQPRESPLACLPEEGGTFLVVGSNFGRDHHPAWSGNLLKTPQATVRFRGHVVPVTATLLAGADREQAWRILVGFWPLYQGYTERSGRELRVFRLSPR